MSAVFDEQLVGRQPLATRLLSQAIARDKLAHAYLLTGLCVEDKWSIARQLVRYLNCTGATRDTEGACNVLAQEPESVSAPCQNCRWLSAGQHPQAWLVLDSEGSKSGKISVEKARALSDELCKTSSYFRTIVVDNAMQESFHRPAANSLLKTIEEPGPNCVFVLFAAGCEDVLPTVVSRCQVIPLANPAFRRKEEGAVNLNVPSALDKSLPRSQAVFQALELSRQMLAIVDQSEEEGAAARLIDSAVGLEIERLGDRIVGQRALARYASDLVSLGETTKTQLRHYVTARAAFDSFALSWFKLIEASIQVMTVR